MNSRQYLERILYRPAEVDAWLADKAFLLEKYHGELGWVLYSGWVRHGVGDSITTYHFDENGARRMIMHADKPCRINSYGDSMTQCAQVNDGETSQEVLASHLDEPVRNYGIGGYSVHQSYVRMRREEKRTPTEYILFGVFTDDHYRNLTGWRNIRSNYTFEKRQMGNVGGSPTLPYVKVNPATGEFAEYPNACPTPDSVYNLCDLDWVYETFKDDFRLRLMVALTNIKLGTPAESYEDIGELARAHGVQTAVDTPETLAQVVETLDTNAALYASMCIVEKVEEFAQANGKKVLYVLSVAAGDFERARREGARFDQPFVDFLQNKGLRYVDLREAHLADFAQFNVSLNDYLNRYFIGHCNPLGNVFVAFATKDKLVEMLDPKPVPYVSNGPESDRRIPYDPGLWAPL